MTEAFYLRARTRLTPVPLISGIFRLNYFL